MKMSSQLVRVASFAAWPSTAAASSLALARAGFKYSGHGESTVCADCQLIVGSWQCGDRPDEIHARRSPNCAFVQQHLQDCVVNSISNSAAGPERSSHGSDVTGRVPECGGYTTTDFLTGSVTRVAHSTANHSSLSCTINRDHPDFERLKDEAVRLSTFFDWPDRVASIVHPGDFAKAGLFYTGQTDRVQCAFCHGYLQNWVQGDIPAEEHRRRFPSCPFVRQQKDFADGGTNLTTYVSVIMCMQCMSILLEMPELKADL